MPVQESTHPVFPFRNASKRTDAPKGEPQLNMMRETTDGGAHSICAIRPVMDGTHECIPTCPRGQLFFADCCLETCASQIEPEGISKALKSNDLHAQFRPLEPHRGTQRNQIIVPFAAGIRPVNAPLKTSARMPGGYRTDAPDSRKHSNS